MFFEKNGSASTAAVSLTIGELDNDGVSVRVLGFALEPAGILLRVSRHVNEPTASQPVNFLTDTSL